MCSAESAIFLCFHSIWMSFLFFCHVVVTLFAFCTCQCDFYTHNCHLQLLIYFSVFRHKKKTYFISLVQYITFCFLSQALFTWLFVFFSFTLTGQHPSPNIRRFYLISFRAKVLVGWGFFDRQRRTFRSSYAFKNFCKLPRGNVSEQGVSSLRFSQRTFSLRCALQRY